MLANMRLFEGSTRTSSVMGIGFLAASAASVATTVIESGAVPILRDVLVQENDQNTLSAAAWALGQIGKHGVEHAVCMGELDVYRELIRHYQKDTSSQDLQLKCKKTLKALLANC